MTAVTYTVRPMRAHDDAGVHDVLEAALGRRPDPRNRDLFAWKHRSSPFGPSPAWVAVDGDRILGFRTMMRWEFVTPDGPVRAVRAVDTATHPDHQGRGIFSALTRAALEELAGDRVDLVFNTPNDKSRPGYLKLGWTIVGRLPVGMRCSPASVPTVLGARTAAQLWSEPTRAGVDARDAFADEEAVAQLLSAVPRTTGFTTRRTPAYLRWRYGFEPLAYRVVTVGSDVADGAVVFRTRRRGGANELVVADLLLPPGSRSVAARLVREALKASGADYALGLRATSPSGVPLPLPRQGPVLTCRTLGTDRRVPGLGSWRFTLGDIELF